MIVRAIVADLVVGVVVSEIDVVSKTPSPGHRSNYNAKLRISLLTGYYRSFWKDPGGAIFRKF